MNIIELLESFLQYSSQDQFRMLSGIGSYNEYWEGDECELYLDGINWTKVQTAIEKHNSRKANSEYEIYNEALRKRICQTIGYDKIPYKKGLKTLFDEKTQKWVAETEGGRRPRRVCRKK